MNIIFMGSPDFALPSLEKLHAGPHAIVAVVSGTDKRRGRGNTHHPTPVKARALQLGLPVIEAEDLKSIEFAEKLRALNPDLLVVVAFRILPRHILAIPRIGSVNLHASLLPKYRGAAPIHRAVMNGETKTGCTVFFLDEKVDTGKIISRMEVPIEPDDNTGAVYQKLMAAGADLLTATVDDIAAGTYTLIEQDDSEATSAPKLFPEDCRIRFDRPAREVHNFIRGLSPFPTAWTLLDGKKLKIYSVRPVDITHLNPGELSVQKDDVHAGCDPGAVSLQTIQLEGRQKVSAPEFFRGYNGPGKLDM